MRKNMNQIIRQRYKLAASGRHLSSVSPLAAIEQPPSSSVIDYDGEGDDFSEPSNNNNLIKTDEEPTASELIELYDDNNDIAVAPTLPSPTPAPNKRPPSTPNVSVGLRKASTLVSAPNSYSTNDDNNNIIRNISNSNNDVEADPTLTNRLTMLDEPERGERRDFIRTLQKNRNTINSISSRSNNIDRETILPTKPPLPTTTTAFLQQHARRVANSLGWQQAMIARENHKPIASASAVAPADDGHYHEHHHLATAGSTNLTVRPCLPSADNVTVDQQQALNQQQQPDRHLLFRFSVFLPIFFILLIFNAWFYKRWARKGNGNSRLPYAAAARFGCADLIIPPNNNKNKNNCVRTRQAYHRKANRGSKQEPTTQEDERLINPATPQNFGCASGERLQLVERKPTLPANNNSSSANGNEHHDEGAIALDSIPTTTNNKINSAKSTEQGLGTVVILKRRFAKSSFVVAAARTTKPRLRLITARVRKFIDDEAEELKVKKQLNLKQPLRCRVLAYVLATLNASKQHNANSDEDNNNNNNYNEELHCCNEQEQLEEQVAATLAPPSQLDQQRQQQHQAIRDEMPIEAEIHHREEQQQREQRCRPKQGEEIEMSLIGCNGNDVRAGGMISATESRQSDIGAEGQCQRDIAQRFPNNLALQLWASALSQQQKLLSPSPVINDGCSSLSACSLLFTPSPIERQQPSCGCLLDRNRMVEAEQLGVFVGARSKSQGPPSSPCRSLVGEPVYTTAPAYRPCCSSVSPSALDQSSAVAAAAVAQQPPLYHYYQQQPLQVSPMNAIVLADHQHDPNNKITYQLTSHHLSDPQCTAKQNNDNNGLYAGLPASNRITAAVPSMSAQTTLNGYSGKCSSHIKRQYENYYDDERQDAYQRLTASIGMELGLGFEAHHHEGSVGHAHSLGYVAAAAAAGNMAELLHSFPRYDCHAHMATSVATATTTAISTVNSNTSCLSNELHHATGQPQPITMSRVNATNLNQNGNGQAYLATASPEQPSCKCCQKPAAANVTSVCPSALCTCQSQIGILTMSPSPVPVTEQPPMSILVQQPSMTTPPPSQQLPHHAAQQRPPTLDAQQQNNQQQSQPSSPQHHPYQHYQHYQSSSASVSPTAKQGSSQADQNDRRSAPGGATLCGDAGSGGGGATRSSASPSGPTSSQAVTFAGSIRSKWKQRRRLSQKQGQEMPSELTMGECYSPTAFSSSSAAAGVCYALPRLPRRMSIAGDHVSSQAVGCSSAQDVTATTHDPLLPGQHQAYHAQSGGPQSNRLLLLHRASIASDGSWNQQSIYNQLKFNTQALEEAQQQTLQNPLSNSQHQTNNSSHRPSDASLYDSSQYCSGALHHGKSNYSSSGGSSSGIGISGSTCTNTSNSVLQYGSFATKADILAMGAYGHLQADQSAAAALCSYQNQCNYYLHGAHHHVGPADFQMACQIPPCPSRKFSLPVQLESHQAATVALDRDRLSPTTTTSRARLLFEKNMNRVDLSSLAVAAAATAISATGGPNTSNGQQQQHPHQQQYLRGARGGFPGESVPVLRGYGQLDSPSTIARQQQERQQRAGVSVRPNMTESRRSSQTITRQSSFWLEDNSVDSVLSLTTSGANCFQSEDGSQLDVNQMPQDEGSFGQQQGDQQQQQPASQRPSISSLVLSGDSIESVKLKPLVAQVPVAEEQQPYCANSAGDSDQQANHQTMDTNGTNNDLSSSQLQLRPEQSGSTTEYPQQSRRKGSSSSSSSASLKEKRNLKSLAHMRNRLSSSSTSSATTSSPSPDFSRPSKRILGLAQKSGSISKRRLFGKLRSRRYLILGASSSHALETGQQVNNILSQSAPAKHRHSAPNSTLSYGECKQESEDGAKSEGYNRYSADADECSATNLPVNKKSEQNADDLGVDNEFLSTPSERPISDLNSASLERQCRELWKLRATLHDDSCVGDNWSNYHQRLNRRYDSGYKSIENQLSSSLEGNVLPANVATDRSPTPSACSGATQLPPPAQAIVTTSTNSSDASLVRPQSGCSGTIWRPTTTMATESNQQQLENNSDTEQHMPVAAFIDKLDCGEFAKFASTIVEADEEFSNQQEEGSIETIDGKLADLELDDGALECLISSSGCDLLERECQSRGSKSSNEDEINKGLDNGNSNYNNNN